MRMPTGIDVSWTSNSGAINGYNSQTPMQHWRSVQLEACKLLELGCVLPATKLPHFQMYRWAFVGTEFDVHEEEVRLPNGSTENLATLPSALYVPHVRRVARLMDMKYTSHSPVSSARFPLSSRNKLISYSAGSPATQQPALDAKLPATAVAAGVVRFL